MIPSDSNNSDSINFHYDSMKIQSKDSKMILLILSISRQRGRQARIVLSVIHVQLRLAFSLAAGPVAESHEKF